MELDPLSTRTLWFYYVSFLYCTVLYCAVGTLGAHFTIYKGAGSDLQVPTVLRCTVLYCTSGVTKPYDYNILAGITLWSPRPIAVLWQMYVLCTRSVSRPALASLSYFDHSSTPQGITYMRSQAAEATQPRSATPGQITQICLAP